MIRLLIISSLAIVTFLSCKDSKIEKPKVTTIKINNDSIQVSVDTLSTILNDNILRTVVEFDKHFYAVIETKKTNEVSLKKMLKISKINNNVENLDIPEIIQQEIIYSLNVENDSLFLVGTGNESFNLDKNGNFKPLYDRKFKLYEDKLYNVYSECNGEWGGEVLFKSKKDNTFFKANITCPFVVNNIENSYYFTIQDIEQDKFYINRITISLPEKAELIYETSELFVSTSFVLNNQLVHLYSDEDFTYLGIVEDGKLIPQYKFASLFHSKLNQQENGKQVLNCYFPKTKRSGILVIESSGMHFYIF